MKTEHDVSKNWDDLVFEKRNKAYGAYLVRKSYSQNMTTGFGVSVCLACLLLIAPSVFSRLFPSAVSPKEITEIIYDVITPTQPPTIEPPQQAVAAPATPQQQSNVPPVVTTAPVETILPTNAAIEASIPDTAPGEGSVAGSSTGNEIADAPPAPPAEPEIYIGGVEVMPAYKGGMREMMQFISRKVRYPGSARRLGTEGTVFVSFVVNKEGKVTDVTLVRGISEDCDKEAMRVIALMNEWSPGKQGNRAVSVRMTLPIKFQIQH